MLETENVRFWNTRKLDPARAVRVQVLKTMQIHNFCTMQILAPFAISREIILPMLNYIPSSTLLYFGS